MDKSLITSKTTCQTVAAPTGDVHLLSQVKESGFETLVPQETDAVFPQAAFVTTTGRTFHTERDNLTQVDTIQLLRAVGRVMNGSMRRER